ncbi:MAG: hypothetical protein EPO32_12315 [Anaerolineae bacterium]|nr:MAG: hypothetical protein EPO32_12315 [Anaerolineae bacterium]
MSQSRWPDFFLIGAAKAGSTFAFHAIGQHPSIFTCEPKEPAFFIHYDPPTWGGPQFEAEWPYISRTDEFYLDLFAMRPQGALAGEGSSNYLLFGDLVAPRMHAHVPDAMLIAILRHPAERAFSHYVMLREMGFEPEVTFDRALKDEPRRIEEHWYPTLCYAYGGEYARQLRPFLDTYGRDRILILFYEVLRASPASLFNEIFQFLGVDSTFVPSMEARYNVRRVVKSRRLENFLLVSNALTRPMRRVLPASLRMKLRDTLRQRNVYRPEITPAERQQVLAACRADTLDLQDMLNCDLKEWLE